MKDQKPHRLTIVNPGETVPRLISGYGKACGGEFAIMLRPAERRGLVVLVVKGEAHVWRATSPQDAPGFPTTPSAVKDAIAEVAAMRQNLPPIQDLALRGQWLGMVHCNVAGPMIELRRKIASYGTLVITNSDRGMWHVKVTRDERWFSGSKERVTQFPELAKAIEGGLALAMGVIGEACSIRDTHRRGSVDDVYAAAHPVRTPKERPDTTDRLREREAKVAKPRKAAAPRAPSSTPPTMGPLVIVPLGATPRHEGELLAVVTGHTHTFNTNPTSSNAKKWLSAALLHLGQPDVTVASVKIETFTSQSERALATARLALPKRFTDAGHIGPAIELLQHTLNASGAPNIRIAGYDWYREGQTQEPDEPRAPRRSRVPREAAARTAPPTKAAAGDSVKDKQLLDMFAAGIKLALAPTA